MNLHEVKKRTAEQQNNEPQNFEGWFRYTLSLFIKQTEYLPSTFDIHYSIFDIRFFRVSFSIGLNAHGQRRR